METIHKHAVIQGNGSLIINEPPMKNSEEVDVLIKSTDKPSLKKYPLRGKPFKLIEPFDGVGDKDWIVMQ